MALVIVNMVVQDYVKWKPYFDEHASVRKGAGQIGERVFRNPDNQNELLILFAWEDLEKARLFWYSADMKQRMKESGVAGEPEFYRLLHLNM